MPEYDATHFLPPAPIARVSLIHPKTDQAVQDVPMLLDTGADVSLVPAKTLRALDIDTLPEEYGLEGFNGTPVTAASAYLCLRFLDLTFRGRFLVINQNIGILGRNVLNHLVLLLDGPRQYWREFMSHSSG